MELVTEKAKERKIPYIIDIGNEYYNATVNGDGEIYSIDINEIKDLFTIKDLEFINKQTNEHIKQYQEQKNPQKFSINDPVRLKETKKEGTIKSVKSDMVLIKIDNEPLFWIIPEHVEKI